MENLVKLIQWIISIFLIIGSIGGFINGDILFAIIVLAIGIFILPPITKKVFGKKKKELSNLQNEKAKEQTRIYNEIKHEYYPPAVQQQGLQILESLYILSTTKNIDTLKGRYEFILNLYDGHINASHNKRFISDIQKSIDQYKSTYYERIPNDYEINLLLKPSKDNLKKFYIECIMNCFKKFFEDQKKQIESLKKQDAKNRRIDKIRETAATAELELQDKGIAKDEIEQYINEIHQLLYSLFRK